MRETTAFEKFFKENYQRFFFYALRLLDDEELCRDVVSECIGLLWQHNEISPDKWFSYTVSNIRNHCLDHLRHQSVHQRYADFYTHILDHEEELQAIEEDERLAAISQVMDTLTPKTRLIIQECFINRKRYSEVAEALGVSSHAVKKHIVGGLKTLRNQLSAQGFKIKTKKVV